MKSKKSLMKGLLVCGGILAVPWMVSAEETERAPFDGIWYESIPGYEFCLPQDCFVDEQAFEEDNYRLDAYATAKEDGEWVFRAGKGKETYQEFHTFEEIKERLRKNLPITFTETKLNGLDVLKYEYESEVFGKSVGVMFFDEDGTVVDLMFSDLTEEKTYQEYGSYIVDSVRKSE